MSILEHEVTLVGSKGRYKGVALFDSGASYSIVRRDIAEKTEILLPLHDPEEWYFETARKGDFIQAFYVVRLELHFSDSEARFSDEFIVFDDCAEAVIIGATTMRKWQIRLDFEQEKIEYRKTVIRLRV